MNKTKEEKAEAGGHQKSEDEKEQAQRIKEKDKAIEKKKREEEAQKNMEDLKQVKSEVKRDEDERVRKLESDVQKYRDLSNELISKDKTLNELMSKLEASNKTETQVQSREVLSDRDILQTCCGGRALQGVLLTKNLKDQLEDRSHLIEVPENVKMTHSPYSHEESEQFYSIHEETKYKKAIQVLGCGAAMSTGVPIYGNVTISASKKRKILRTESGQQKDIYSSTAKFSTLHVASYSFKKTDLKLCQDARHELHDLLKIIDMYGKSSSNIQEVSERFFHTFGSHVNSGPLKYGGHFWLTCSSRGFDQSKQETVNKLQNEAISHPVFSGFSMMSTEMNIDHVKGSYQDKFSKDTLASTCMQIISLGGPPEASNLAQWKDGLVKNNSTWILTDRGKKLIAVWEIIRLNHDKELGKVREVLKCSWEKMTGLKAELDYLSLLSFNPVHEVEKINGWNKDERMTSQQADDRLTHLLKVKKDIVEKTGSDEFWINEYLSNSTVQTFLVSLICPSPLEQFEHINFLMLQLVEQDQLHKFDTDSFPDIVKVREWLYKSSQPQKHPHNYSIVDFTSFNLFLKRIMQSVDINEKLGEVTEEVTKAICEFRNHFKNTYDDILIKILLLPFQRDYHDDLIMLNTLSLHDLGVIQVNFKLEKEKFDNNKKKGYKHLQLYLLLHAISQSKEEQVREVLIETTEAMKKLNPPLEENILSQLNQYFNNSYLEGLKSHLESLKSDVVLPPNNPNTRITKSLMDVLTTQSSVRNISVNHQSLEENPDALSLLEKLDLIKWYPNKLQLKDAMCIRPETLQLSLGKSQPTDPKQLPFLVLHKLMSYDCNCMSELLTVNDNIDNEDTESDDYSDSDDDSSAVQQRPSRNSVGVHPVDCFLALLICSDSFLCQDLFSRLAKCQFAVPFILPDPFTKQLVFPLWCMRSIIKEWKTTKKGKIVDQVCPIVNYPMPIVSIIRFGQHVKHGSSSKSKLLNEIISNPQHNHFFHRDCPGGQYDRILGEGLVDMCCYLPAGKTSDIFPDAIMFLNLHGDAKNHSRQLRFICNISSICLVLIAEANIEFADEAIECMKVFNSSSPGGIIILNDVEQKPKSLKKRFPDAFLVQLTSKTGSEIRNKICRQITRKLVDVKNCKTIEELHNMKDMVDLVVDEDSTLYKEGFSYAKKIQSMIIDRYKIKDSSIKETMLPLQGEDMWRAWASRDKEQHRQNNKGKKTITQYTAEIEKEKAKIRFQQLKYVTSLTLMMESFVECLLKLRGPSNRIPRNYFLQCLKLQLNTLSRESISGMKHEYQRTRKTLSELQAENQSKNDETKTKRKNMLKRKLEHLQESIIETSLNLGHFFREVGQLYEAVLESRKYGDNLSQLPRVVAELLIEGYPLELMDGDAAHVPLKWIQAVLNEAMEMLEDPNIFVLSTLGLQSTGKSTMLNTMFGLQFNVSAGRCTRGAFMQLLLLDDNLKSKIKCSHFLIVDTEGLRAPELDPLKMQKHDNELATFVIGLANMTLINIYGEVSGDIDDILQTSVHAFLRMIQIKYHPSCQFVHQNAEVNILGEVGHVKFTDKLNKFTCDAAKVEQCEGQLECFSDVIKFDDQTDVHYFPGLWNGSPPMAPVNQEYSIAAQSLKNHIVEEVAGRILGDFSFSSFQVKIKDLWEALLKEKFVFSFRNTLEITAYNSLEAAYSDWVWNFKEAMLKWELKAENEIKTEPTETVRITAEKKIKELKDYVHDLYKSLASQMEDFFNGKQNEILVQWKAKFEIRLSNLSDILRTHAEEHCRNFVSSKEAILLFEEDGERTKESIRLEVQRYIENFKQEQENLKRSLRNKSFETEQLNKILERGLFNDERIAGYREKQIITVDQEKEINAIVIQNGGKMTITCLKSTLEGGEILSVQQVQKILKQWEQTEQELKKEFDMFWIQLIRNLPPLITSTSLPSVEAEVERELSEYVKIYEGSLISKLNETKLHDRGDTLELKVKKDAHFKKMGGFIRGPSTSECESKANEITKRVFDSARHYIQEKTKVNTAFRATYIQELLRQVELQIAEESITVKEQFTFTPEYKLDMYLTVCGYALPSFEKMDELFREQTNPRLQLEKREKVLLFTKFKNQYYQMAQEEAIAETLCTYLEGLVKIQVRKSLSRQMVSKMRHSAPYFADKKALKVKILTDLLKEDNFLLYMFYVEDVGRCLECRLEDYTISYCNEKLPNGSTRLQVSARECVTNLIGVIENVVTFNTADASKWLEVFCTDKKLRSELAFDLKVSDFDTVQELDLDSFKTRIRTRLIQLKKTLHDSFDEVTCESEMPHWNSKPHELLSSLVGCRKQCPFCKEQCDLRYQHEGKCRTNIHRITCLAGTSLYKNQQLTTDICPALIASDRTFKKDESDTFHRFDAYDKIYKDWSIIPDTNPVGSKYWKRFVAYFKVNLGEHFNLEPPAVPNHWLKIEKEEIEEDLKNIYKL